MGSHDFHAYCPTAGCRNYDTDFPLTVHVARKPGRSFSNSMRDARSWLDHHQITATSFKTVTNAKGGIGFDIGFNTEDEASLFESDFA
jgi:hypothetical protein